MTTTVQPAPQDENKRSQVENERLEEVPDKGGLLPAAPTPCEHDFVEREVAVIADGLCPLCLQRDLAAARAENERLRKMNLTDEQIMSSVIREVDTLDCTRVSEMTSNGWKATTIFEGDEALLRCVKKVLHAAIDAALAEKEKP